MRSRAGLPFGITFYLGLNMNDDTKNDETGTPAPEIDLLTYVLFFAVGCLIGYGAVKLYFWMT